MTLFCWYKDFVFKTQLKFITIRQVINILRSNKLDNRKIINCLLADYILSEIGIETETKIQVCSCDNFIIVKGTTSSKEIIKLSDVLEKFYEKYDFIQKRTKNIIDLIEYDKKTSKDKKMSFTFTNNKNCGPTYEDNNNDFFSVSTFPYGYSLNQNRIVYYYFKHIVYNIPPTYPFTKINFEITNENDAIDFEIKDDYMNNEDDCLKSTILDVFDFNLSSFQEDIKTEKLDYELLESENDIPILKKINKNFILI